MTEFAAIKGKQVAIVLGSLELGGSERQALHLARFMRAQGAHVHVWGFDEGGLAASMCEKAGILWSFVPFGWPANRAKKLRNLLVLARTLKRTRPDILLPYTVWPNLACGLVWRLTGARACIWNQREIGVYPASERAARWAARLTPSFVANSHAGKEFLVEGLGVDSHRIRVIRNGVLLPPPVAERTVWRNQLGFGEDDFVACMVANITERKDHATLLKAWRMVVDVLDAKLVLAGYFGNAHYRMKALAFDLDLGQHVRFLGQVKDIAGLLGAVDLGVFSSRLEGCPNGVLECMAAGLPMVATDIPGVREAVGPTGYPFLSAPEDAEALAALIVTLAETLELRSALGAANRLRIGTEFSLQRMCEDTTALAAETMEGAS